MSAQRWVVLVSTVDIGPLHAHGPYRTREAAQAQAARMKRAADRYNEQAEAAIAEQATSGSIYAHSPDRMEIQVLPITGGSIPVRSYQEG
jgi:hypothetical protein